MIIKMVNEFKLTVVHFARPNPMQICACAGIPMRVDLPLGKKTVENQGARSIQPKFQPVRPGKVVHLKRWTRFFETFPVGPKFPEILVEWIAPRTKPPGLRAAGQPGRWASGLRGCRGPRAAGPSGRRAAGPSRAVGRGPVFSKTPGFERRNSMLVMCPLHRSDWSCHEGILVQPIRSTTQQI